MQSRYDYSEIFALLLSFVSVMVILICTLVLLTSCGAKKPSTTHLTCSQSGTGNQQNCAQGGDSEQDNSSQSSEVVDAEDEKECCGDICMARGNARGSDDFIDCVIECLDESQCTEAPEDEKEETELAQL